MAKGLSSDTPKGLSLHIGVNRPTIHFAGRDCPNLRLCENDAHDMAALARCCKFTATCILTREATVNRIVNEIRRISSDLKPGDFFLLTYSGHGAPYGKHAEWIVRDDVVPDYCLFELWEKLESDVRVLVISDSCYSGTTASDINVTHKLCIGALRKKFPRLKSVKIHREMTMRHALVLNPSPPPSKKTKNSLRCTVMSIGASGVTTSDVGRNATARNGYFTEKLLATWNNGRFRGTYQGFFQSLTKAMKVGGATPVYGITGTGKGAFEKQHPFTI